MVSNATAEILRRKVGQARTERFASRSAADPVKALQDAFHRASEEELELKVKAQEIRERYVSPEELLETLPDQAFLAVLLGPEEGSGLLCFDAVALSAVIEMRTMGRIFKHPSQPRRTTQTDAAMVADLIDRILAEFEAPLLESEAARWASGWRYQMFLADPRPLSVLLEEGTHRLLEADINFADGAKEGKVLLALPASGRATPRPPMPPDLESSAGRAAETWSRSLEDAVGNAEACLNVVLGRTKLSLETLSHLSIGDRIVLPASALSEVKLLATGDKLAGEGRLGQSGGMRAVKVSEPTHPVSPIKTEGHIVPADMLQVQTRNDDIGSDLADSVLNMTPATPETIAQMAQDLAASKLDAPEQFSDDLNPSSTVGTQEAADSSDA